ncbi:MAG: ribosylnicotinamide kinase [Icmadophila ericetorum]|nr:ribosylnicotinamide kinase [Icmadophila ericetorum]
MLENPSTTTTIKKSTIVGLSGCSSSGKTTLARLLRSIFPSILIIHEDDFYYPEEKIPVDAATGLLDWDCAGSLDIEGIVRALEWIHEKGELPEWLESKEDRNSAGEHGVPESVVQELSQGIRDWWERGGGKEVLNDQKKLVILDGFLLFGERIRSVREALDLKIMLRARFETAKQRREARSGYVTLEGFWEDPPGYVEKIVWPNYVKYHAFLFEDGDVEGNIKGEVVDELGIVVCPGQGEWSMERVLVWAVEVIKDSLNSTKIQ